MADDVELLRGDLVRAVGLLADVFAAKSIRYTLIGGLGAILRGRARFTRDIDVLLDVPQLVLPGLLDNLIEAGFKLDQQKVIREFVHDRITSFQYRDVRIDWVRPVLPLYARAIASATPMSWGPNRHVNVASAESLILTKLVAFRSQDQLDIETLIAANRDDIDLDDIRKQWAEISENEDERTEWLERAIKQFAKRQR